MDAFEKKIKNSLDQYEVPYNSADWAQLEKALDGQSGHGRWSSSGLLALFVGGALITGTVLYLGSRPDRSSPATELVPMAGPEDRLPEDPKEQNGSESNGATSDAWANTDLVAEERKAEADEASEPVESTPESQVIVPGKVSDDPERNTGSNNRQNEQKTVPSTLPTGPVGNAPKDVTEVDGLTIQASALEGCPGTSIRFSVSNMPEEGIYLWNFGDGSFSNKPVPEHLFAKSGKFEVMLSVSSTDKGNIKNNPSSGHIVIHEAPDAKFHYSKQEFEGHIPSVHFENRSLGGVSYRWDFGDGNSSTIAHPDHVFRKQGTYTVKLSVMNEKGCVDKYEREIHIERDYTLGAPATFSPNGDGVEDTFMPQTLRDLGVKFDLVIHEEKTGRQVFRTSDASIPWTGRVMNGSQLCPSGEYVWMVEIHEGAHIGDVVYDGKVSLVR
ncbi:MAG: PKD domain-containing protein [Flavobacteriales bacterium]|nr:PKD domain-containing protein [Flavobacteriales bacterium]